VCVLTDLSVQPNTGKYTLARFSRKRKNSNEIEKIYRQTDRRTSHQKNKKEEEKKVIK